MSQLKHWRAPLGRYVVAVLGIGMLALALDAQSGARAEGSWCALVQGPDGGYVSCSYSSREQCMESLSGNGGICHRNPEESFRRIEKPSPRSRF